MEDIHENLLEKWFTSNFKTEEETKLWIENFISEWDDECCFLYEKESGNIKEAYSHMTNKYNKFKIGQIELVSFFDKYDDYFEGIIEGYSDKF